LIKNYSAVQKKLSIKSLPEWADVDIGLLSEVLESLGKINYSEEEGKYVDNDRLKCIAYQIVENGKLLKKALQ